MQLNYAYIGDSWAETIWRWWLFVESCQIIEDYSVMTLILLLHLKCCLAKLTFRVGLRYVRYLGRAWASPTLAGLHCVDVYVYDRACLWPYTINFNCSFKNISWNWTSSCTCMAMLGYYRSAALATVAEMTQVSGHTVLRLTPTMFYIF